MKLKLGSVVIGLLLLYLRVVFVSNNININTCRIVYSLESRKVGSNCKRERESLVAFMEGSIVIHYQNAHSPPILQI